MADTIRDDLAVLIGDLINVWTIGNPKGLADPDLPTQLADDILAYLGNLDPATDAHLSRRHPMTDKQGWRRLTDEWPPVGWVEVFYEGSDSVWRGFRFDDGRLGVPDFDGVAWFEPQRESSVWWMPAEVPDPPEVPT